MYDEASRQRITIGVFILTTIGLLLGVCACAPNSTSTVQTQVLQTGIDTGLLPATLKLTEPLSATLTWQQQLTLHAGRQEYEPFQIVISGTETALEAVQVTVDADPAHFTITLYDEYFVPLNYPVEPVVHTLNRITNVEAIADGLIPHEKPLAVPLGGFQAVWIDLLVLPDTPAGSYTLPVTLTDVAGWTQTLTVEVIVYDVDIVALPSMDIVVPLESEWTIPFYANGDTQSFHYAVNDLLIAHNLIPGTFADYPVWTGDGWDFSPLDQLLDALPTGVTFHAPSPYDERTRRYLLFNEKGKAYKSADFSDPYFVAQATAYFQGLADYLRGKERLADAVLYPVDETRWVGDEPLHNGPDGFERLAQWTALIREQGLRVRASEVLPVPPGPEALGWLPSAEVTDDVHVHLDYLDAAPDTFAAWMEVEGQTASVYLNNYGDMIDLPAAVERGFIWHSYKYGIRDMAGYAALEWVDAKYELIDPWTNPDDLYPQYEYGGGALIWPPRAGSSDPLPSLRLKVLRDGVEDARLLDLYAVQYGRNASEALAACLTPGSLAQQQPAADLWDRAHAALLAALANGTPVALDTMCLTLPEEPEQITVIDLNSVRTQKTWEFTNVETEFTANSDTALHATFHDDTSEVGYWFGDVDWSAWSALRLRITNASPYFTRLDVGLVDSSVFMLLYPGSVLLGPNQTTTLTLQLDTALSSQPTFDWSDVRYLSLHAATSVTLKDGDNTLRTYPLGDRTLIFEAFELVR